MNHESHFGNFRSKHPCANSNPNLGQQCKEKSWAEETLIGSWAPRVLWWENCWGNGRANFGVQQFPMFNLLEPEELDWQVCLSWLEGKRGLDTRVPVNLHSSKYSWGNGLKDAIWRWWNLAGDGLKDSIQECLLNCVIGGNENWLFWNAGSRLRLFSQDVAVSKSRHRLLFYPTRKGQKHRKIPFWDISRVREVDYRKGRC